MNYIQTIQTEPLKERYEKSDLLIPKYLITESGKINIYYAPFEFINIDASIIIVGITPGWTQMEKSFRTIIHNLHKGNDWNTAIKEGKKEASFAGSMRKNLIAMLDELELNKKLKIESTSELFTTHSSIVHSTSVLKYPVFINGENYTGKNPTPIGNSSLWSFVKNNFVPEINSFRNKLIIPLGVTVSEVLKKLMAENLINSNVLLEDFPHPSGANGHRKKLFEDNKAKMKAQIIEWLL